MSAPVPSAGGRDEYPGDGEGGTEREHVGRDGVRTTAVRDLLSRVRRRGGGDRLRSVLRVVDFATPILVESLTADFPEYVPGAARTWAAAALWIVLALTILGQLVEQSGPNPHVFETREDLVHFLQDERPSEWGYQLNVTLALLGGIVVWALWSAFWNALEELLRATPELDAVVPSRQRRSAPSRSSRSRSPRSTAGSTGWLPDWCARRCTGTHSRTTALFESARSFRSAAERATAARPRARRRTRRTSGVRRRRNRTRRR